MSPEADFQTMGMQVASARADMHNDLDARQARCLGLPACRDVSDKESRHICHSQRSTSLH